MHYFSQGTHKLEMPSRPRYGIILTTNKPSSGIFSVNSLLPSKVTNILTSTTDCWFCKFLNFI